MNCLGCHHGAHGPRCIPGCGCRGWEIPGSSSRGFDPVRFWERQVSEARRAVFYAEQECQRTARTLVERAASLELAQQELRAAREVAAPELVESARG